jgi:hypothetical protein
VYWFRSNEFSTLLQEEWECQDQTIWSLMTQEAYEDCMKHGWTTVEAIQSRTSLQLVTPNDIIQGKKGGGRCTRCYGVTRQKGCNFAPSIPLFILYTTVFVDCDGVLYTPPADTTV